MKATSLQELIKKYLDGKTTLSSADTFDEYKHKNGLSYAKSYSDAIGSAFANAKRNSSSYGTINRDISNKGLQNSGYAKYLDDLAQNNFKSDLAKLKDTYAKKDASAGMSYASYLDKYRDKQNALRSSVMSHLVTNDVVDINTAVAYGMSAGLSEEDAIAVGKNAYEVTKKKIFDKLIEQTVNLGLDKDGAEMLAIKMGISDEDAKSFANEIGELLEHYQKLSSDYLEYLENKAG